MAPKYAGSPAPAASKAALPAAAQTGVGRANGSPRPFSWSGTIYGEPASKSNSRQLVTIKGRPAFIKSKKARDYLSDLQKQVPRLPSLLEGPLRFTATIFYSSNRPDLDESVILDGLQSRIYGNDRQIVERSVVKAIDKRNPRAIVTVETIP